MRLLFSTERLAILSTRRQYVCCEALPVNPQIATSRSNRSAFLRFSDRNGHESTGCPIRTFGTKPDQEVSGELSWCAFSHLDGWPHQELAALNPHGKLNCLLRFE